MEHEISRRSFVKGLAAGAASLAAIGLVDKVGRSPGGGSVSGTADTAAGNGGAASIGAEEIAVFAAMENISTDGLTFVPGTYTAAAAGLGPVRMSAVFDEKSITAITLDTSYESADVGQAAADTLIRQCLAAQGTDIDGVSGATLTANAVRKCLRSCILQAAGLPDDTAQSAASTSPEGWLGEAPEIPENMVDEELDADVLVIGCGVAGVAAVRAAAEEGAKVAAVEKASGPQCRSGEYAVINGKVQRTWGRDTWTREQINQMVDFHMMESGYKAKRAIVSKWANNIADVFDWWIAPNPDLYIAPETRSPIPDENAGNFLIPIFYPLPAHYDWTKEAFPCYPASVEFLPNQSVNVRKNMEAALDTGNVDARYGHFAEKLIMEDGVCVGAYVRNAETNGYVRVNAKAVILATGDYSQNEAMVRHFCPDVIENGIVRMFTNTDVEGNFTNTGDGIKLGVWAGAAVQKDHAPMIHHMGGGADLEGVGVMGNAGFLNLDRGGRRFMNEDLPGQQIENQIELQRDRKTWQIFDADWPKQLPYMPAAHGGACYVEHYRSKEDGPRNNWTYRNYKSPYQLEAAIADGRCITADTLEGLAALMYPDDEAARETALASIERYNRLAKAGEDLDFGKPARRMWALEHPPYYADQFEPALLLVICGGLESDEEAHALDTRRKPIPGLYAAGNVQGNRFAHEYPITLKGVSHSMAMYYGYVAGKNAASGV